jgi:hypothetical protein
MPGHEEEQHDFQLWRPEAADESAAGVDLTASLLDAARTRPEDVAAIVAHMVAIGQTYQAARCLEILAQQRLGLEFTGGELISYDAPRFGAFHRDLHDLLQAGALYHQARRHRTARAAIRRALLFVEEAIRNINDLDRVDNGEMACLGLAFELAGHCCVALEDRDGLDYYHAAQRYWGQSARMRPEALFQWTHHPVTRTVIRCLGPVVEIRPVDSERRDGLFAADYVTRIDTAKSLLA